MIIIEVVVVITIVIMIGVVIGGMTIGMHVTITGEVATIQRISTENLSEMHMYRLNGPDPRRKENGGINLVDLPRVLSLGLGLGLRQDR